MAYCLGSKTISNSGGKAAIQYNEIIMINNGRVADQIVGQFLRTIFAPYVEPTLYCWNREEAGSNAEIDYIIQHENEIIAIEEKAGSSGTLKSLHLFMGLKKTSGCYTY